MATHSVVRIIISLRCHLTEFDVQFKQVRWALIKQEGDTSIHPVLRSSSSVKIPIKSQTTKSEQVKGQTVIIKVQ